MKRRWRLLFSIGLLLLGGLFVIGSSLDIVDTVHPAASSRHADGQVIDTYHKTTGDGSNYTTTYYAVVRFVTAREQVIVFTTDGCSGCNSGDRVAVRYDSEDPRDARLDSAEGRVGAVIPAAITLVIGLFMMFRAAIALDHVPFGVVARPARSLNDRD